MQITFMSIDSLRVEVHKMSRFVMAKAWRFDAKSRIKQL